MRRRFDKPLADDEGIKVKPIIHDRQFLIGSRRSCATVRRPQSYEYKGEKVKEISHINRLAYPFTLPIVNPFMMNLDRKM